MLKSILITAITSSHIWPVSAIGGKSFPKEREKKEVDAGRATEKPFRDPALSRWNLLSR